MDKGILTSGYVYILDNNERDMKTDRRIRGRWDVALYKKKRRSYGYGLVQWKVKQE